jgi:hypothetical protein
MPWWSLWNLENQLALNLGCSKFTLGFALILAHLNLQLQCLRTCNHNQHNNVLPLPMVDRLDIEYWRTQNGVVRWSWSFGHGAWREVVAHLWLHVQPFRSQHLDEWPGKYAPTLYAYNWFKTCTGPLPRICKKNTLLRSEQACDHLMNVPQAFDKCHRSDPCLNWMKMKPGSFLCKKVCQTELA